LLVTDGKFTEPFTASFIYYVATNITIMYNIILVEKQSKLNQKKKVIKRISLSDNDLLYSLVDKAYYVDGIHHKIDNNLCMDNTDF
jgi:hypothetical protein